MFRTFYFRYTVCMKTKKKEKYTLTQEKERGVLLTLWLLFLLIVYTLSIGRFIYLFFETEPLKGVVFSAAALVIWGSFLARVGGLVCAIFLLKWKKWALWGMLALYGIAVLLNVIDYTNVYIVIGPLVGAVITVLLVRKKWIFFE